jgi:hypothetical protein
MNENFLTIKQAVTLTSRSEATIRRIIKKAINMKSKKAIKEGSLWFIDKDFLLEQLKLKPNGQEIDKTELRDDLTIQALIKQLEIKDQQIEELNKRLSEANILHKQLQDHLFEKTKQITEKKPNSFRRLFTRG